MPSAPDSGTFNFEPSARLQRFLGRELIADPNVAIGEFIKNAYDAGASRVTIEFQLAGRVRSKQRIIISDNGSGMTQQDFRANWLRPGYSAKAESAKAVKVGPAKARVPVGEKGVGRLAAGRLGTTLDVYTRRAANAPWLKVAIDWSKFDDGKKAMSSIKLPYELGAAPPDAAYPAGTRIEIGDLTLNWAAGIPGRKAVGRADTRLGRLREDLEVLLLPLNHANDFEVELKVDEVGFEDVVGAIKVSAGAPPAVGYQMDFNISKGPASTAKVKWTITRSTQLIQQTAEPRKSTGTETWRDENGLEVLCGSFSGVFIYDPPQLKSNIRTLQPGVLVYRDGVRVEPYGREDDDWLEARRKKASRQGYAPIQPKKLAGVVRLSKKNNRELIDMSNRQGLVENDGYAQFVALSQVAFDVLADHVFRELVKPGWETSEARAAAAARRADVYTNTIVRSRVHSLRQPLATASLMFKGLRPIVTKTDMAESVRSQLLDTFDSIKTELDSVHTQVTELLNVRPDLSPEEFAISAAIDDAAARVEPTAQRLGVSVQRTNLGRHRVTGPRDALVESITAVMQNAVEVPRPAGREPIVTVSVERAGDEIRVVVVDNGKGMSATEQRRMFEENYSTKGGTGAGMSIARQTIALFAGSVAVRSTSKAGTTVDLTMPTIGAVRRETRGFK